MRETIDVNEGSCVTSISLTAFLSPRARVSIPAMWAMNKSSTSVLSLRLHICKETERKKIKQTNRNISTLR